MTPLTLRMGLLAFVVLSGAMAANIFVLQPPGRTTLAVSTETRLDALRQSLATTPAPATTGEPQAAPEPKTAAPEGKLAAAGASSDLTRAIQRELKAKGYEVGAIDGTPTLVTRAAIMAYEADSGLALTAEPAQALLQHLVLGSGGSVPSAGARLSPAAETVVRTVEEQLSRLGYGQARAEAKPAPVGLSEETARAIRSFEAAQKMKQTGRISGELVAKLATLIGQPAVAIPARRAER